MDILRSEDVERSMYEHLFDALKPDGVEVWRSGQVFQGKGTRWCDIRIISEERGPEERLGRESHPVTVQVNCYLQHGSKAQKFQTLAMLADRVREVVDSTCNAQAAKVRNEGRQVVAILDWGPAIEARTFDVTVSVGDQQIPGCDVATMTVRCILSRSSGR